jgi:poly[(R)-3-hydroxyalkanoate] polymerase subunit PhaC
VTSPDVVGALRREMSLAGLRLRNGLAYARGEHTERVQPTAKDMVWQRDKITLWRCRSEGVRQGPPVLAMIGLVSRSYVLDLAPGNTFVGALAEAGFDVYLLDWGVPDEADAVNSLDTYASRYLPRVINVVKGHSGSDSINLLAYCMGAQLALLYLAQRRDHGVRAMVTLAPPVDFDAMGFLARPFRDPSFPPESLIDDKGLVPASVVARGFAMKTPTFDVVRYVDLMQKLADQDKLEAHAAMTTWIRDHVPWPGAAFQQMVQMFIRDNAFVNGTARVNGRRADLADIDIPILNVMAERDDVVPLEASAALADLVPAELYDEFRIKAGHVGLVLGRTAARVTIPTVIEWMLTHSEPKERGQEHSAADHHDPSR